MQVICVYEENHGCVGVAISVENVVDGLIKEGWLSGNTELLDEYDNVSTIEEAFGENWENELKTADIDSFNIIFDGLFYLCRMEIWGTEKKE